MSLDEQGADEPRPAGRVAQRLPTRLKGRPFGG
jgi:hypothetical protein